MEQLADCLQQKKPLNVLWNKQPRWRRNKAIKYCKTHGDPDSRPPLPPNDNNTCNTRRGKCELLLPPSQLLPARLIRQTGVSRVGNLTPDDSAENAFTGGKRRRRTRKKK